VQTLWTLRDAGISVREPVKNFYDALTNTQKNAFAGQQPQSSPHADAKAADNSMNKQYQACAAQNAEKAEHLIKEIEMRVRPNKDQAASLENLHKVSADMAKLLIASCVQPIPVDPVARLDATGDQLTAMNYAATTVQIAFDNFSETQLRTKGAFRIAKPLTVTYRKPLWRRCSVSNYDSARSPTTGRIFGIHDIADKKRGEIRLQ
jgi:hypothetical protein